MEKSFAPIPHESGQGCTLPSLRWRRVGSTWVCYVCGRLWFVDMYCGFGDCDYEWKLWGEWRGND